MQTPKISYTHKHSLVFLEEAKKHKFYHFHIFIKLGVRFSRIIAKRRKEKSYPTPHTLLNKVCERENNRPLAYIFTTSHKLTLIIYTHTPKHTLQSIIKKQHNGKIKQEEKVTWRRLLIKTNKKYYKYINELTVIIW